MIKEFPINDGWLFRKNFLPECISGEQGFTDAYVVQLPHNYATNERSYFDERNMRLTSAYMRTLTLPEKYVGKRFLLKVEGVLSYAEVYVNGIFVTSHKGEGHFYADITAPLRCGYANKIVLKVDSSLRSDIPGSGVRGPLTLFGGISRGVTFMICDGRDIRDVCIRTRKSGDGFSIEAAVDMYDYYPDTTLTGEIMDADGKFVCALTSKSVLSSFVTLSGEAANIEPWSVDNPVRYEAVIRLTDGKKVIDEKRIKFGFTTADFKTDSFYLNGKPLKLIGLLRADDYPGIGRAGTSQLERRDARLIKSAGCNAVRTMGQPSKDFIDECSRIGLLVIVDMYGDGYVGGAKWRETYLNSLRDMIVRDRNEPCVIGWGVRVNNSPDCDELYFKAQKLSKETDPTRATVGARSFSGSRAFEDVFSLDTSVRSSKKGLNPIPFIIAHGGRACPTKSEDPESVRLKQALDHLDAIDRTLGGGAVGCFGMSFGDFSAPRGSGAGDNVNHYGVFDGYRNPKLAGWAYRSQTDSSPVLKLSSNLSRDDFTGKLYIFTNADSVVMYRDGVKAGEFFPDRTRYKNLPHPPIVIDDFCGDIPATEVGDGLKLKLFKDMLRAADKYDANNLGFLTSWEALLFRILTKREKADITALLEKYSRLAPGGVTYKFDGVYGGEVKASAVLSPDIDKTLKVWCSDTKTLKCGASFDRFAFTLAAEDGYGNLLDYCSSPVVVRAHGSIVVDGDTCFSLRGGMGGFFVKSVSSGEGHVTVTSEFGTQNFAVNCKYEESEEKF